MKKALAMIAVVGLVAVPLAAAPIVQFGPQDYSITQIDGTLQNPFFAGSRSPGGYQAGTENLYDNMWNSLPTGLGGPGPAAYTGGLTLPSTVMLVDDVHIASSLSSATLGGMHWIFYNPSFAGPSSSVAFGPADGFTTDTLAFFSNPGGANTAIGATFVFGHLASVSAGFLIFNLDLSANNILVPKDFWVGFRKDEGLVAYLFGGPVSAGAAGPELATLTGGSTTLTGSIFSGLSGGGSLFMAFDGVPEPATIALLSLGGLVALRRRRLA